MTNTRQCLKCGKMHNNLLEEAMTGKVLETFDQCKDCLMDALFASCKKHWDNAQIDVSWTEEELKHRLKKHAY